MSNFIARPVAMAATLAAALSLAGAAKAQVASTTGGQASGVTAEGVTSFKGIPFAAPPVGPLRWRAPQPAAPWQGVRDGSSFGPACPQHLPPAWGAPDPKWSEDCLYLNVWRPEGAKPGGKLPVMVWIYGGGFTVGYGGSAIYNGSNLVRNGVVVVNLNYRLGRLGWFAHPELTKESAGQGTGDFGLMDQVAALAWVKRNIAAFGGDPDNVTVFGESAGAMSVNLLMTMPAARGLFAKAITESGLGRIPAKPLARAEAQGTAFAAQAGATDLKSLRALPVTALLANISQPEDDPDNGSGPILDGVLVPENVETAFAAGHEAKVPWIVGSNSYEASLFPGFLADPDGKVLSLAPAPVRPFVIKVFDPDNTGDHKVAAANLLTDKVFTEPARHLADLHEKNGSPVWRYFFAYTPESQRPNPGAGHGSEIQFVFGTLGTFYAAPKGYTDTDRATAAAMGRYWTDFAKTGDPNGAGLAPWPDEYGDHVMVIDEHGFHAADGLRKVRLDLMERTPTP